MSKRDTITFKYNKKEFRAYTEPTYLELQKIDSIAAGLFGGLIELNKALEELRVIENNLGEINENNLLDKPQDYAIYFSVKSSISRVYAYARLKVLLANPLIDIDKLGIDELDELSSAFEVALKPFWRATRRHKKVS